MGCTSFNLAFAILAHAVREISDQMLLGYGLSVIAIIGGLLVPQFPTLWTMRVIYLYRDRISYWLTGRDHKPRGQEPEYQVAAERVISYH